MLASLQTFHRQISLLHFQSQTYSHKKEKSFAAKRGITQCTLFVLFYPFSLSHIQPAVSKMRAILCTRQKTQKKNGQKAISAFCFARHFLQYVNKCFRILVCRLHNFWLHVLTKNTYPRTLVAESVRKLTKTDKKRKRNVIRTKKKPSGTDAADKMTQIGQNDKQQTFEFVS